MNCALFAKMDKIISLKKQNIKKVLEKWQKNTGKVREFCKSGKVVTLVKTVIFSKKKREIFGAVLTGFPLGLKKLETWEGIL